MSTQKSQQIRLDDMLQRHWDPNEPLTVTDELPRDLGSSVLPAFIEAVDSNAPSWVMLPVPPMTRERAMKALAALRRRGLTATLRPAPGAAKRWSVWAKRTQTHEGAVSA